MSVEALELIKRGIAQWVAHVAYWCVRIGWNFEMRKDVIEREAL